MCDLKAGDFVECIDNKPAGRKRRTMPELGRFYTIESMRPAADGFSVRLNEVVPDCRRGGACACGRCGWDSSRFRRIYRPSPEKIAALTALLDAPELFDMSKAESNEQVARLARPPRPRWAPRVWRGPDCG
jgi:hypothetical protein